MSQGRARATTTPIVSTTRYTICTAYFADRGFLHEVVSDEKTKDAVIIDPANPSEYVQRTVCDRYHLMVSEGTAIVEESRG